MSLREAADLVGVSRPTLFRAVQRGELPVRTETVGKSKRILVSREAVQDWACSREQGELVQEQGESVHEQAREQTTEQPREQPEQVPLLAHLDLVRLLEDTQVRLLEATERAHRAERQNDLLKMEILTTRNVLTENAQSLSERAATQKQHEQLRQQWEHERAQLEAENTARLSLYEQEKQQWISEVETSRARVDWLEKRVPKWVRGLFGAG